MKDEDKSKEELLKELAELRQSLPGFEESYERHKQDELDVIEANKQSTFQAQQVPLALIKWTTDFKVTLWSDMAEHIFGFTCAEAEGSSGFDLIIPESNKELAVDLWRQLLTREGGHRTISVNTAKDGTRLLCEWHNTPHVADDGSVVGVSSLVQDISGRKQAEGELKEYIDELVLLVKDRSIELMREVERHRKAEDELQLFRAALDSSADNIFLTDRATMHFVDVNDAACKDLGYTREEFLQMGPHDIKPDYTLHTMVREFDEVLRSDGEVGVIETVHMRKDGTQFPVELLMHSIMSGGRDIIVAIARDITERKVFEDKLKHLSTTDELTQALNRRKYLEIMDREVERVKRHAAPLSILIFDIDYFKAVNDTYGHDVGDDILKAVAELVRDNVRKVDYFVRWGGEEFVVIIPDTELYKAIIFAEKLRVRMEEHVFDKVGSITVSVGVSTYEKDDTQETLIKRADRALYQAKQTGRNKVVSSEDLSAENVPQV